MKRRSPAIFALLALLGAAYFSYRDGKVVRSAQAPTAAQPKPAQTTKENVGESTPDSAALAEIPPAPASPPPPSNQRFSLMPDGSPVPQLPSNAPQRVKVGVALFRYRGAQAPPESTRTREEARKLAEEALALGVEKFADAVKAADRGSSQNIGWMPRGYLEPSVEYSVFTVDKGQLAPAPIDTPRGYWVVKRIR